MLIAFLYWPALIFAATPLPKYTILRSAGPISIDGLLDEASWQYVQPVHPLGTILDRSPRDQRSSKWNGEGLQVAVQIDSTLSDESDSNRRWNTEIAIPWTAAATCAPQPNS